MTTPFVETNALLAAMDGDREQAEAILSGSHDSELETFSRALAFLRDIVTAMQIARRDERRRIDLDARTILLLDRVRR